MICTQCKLEKRIHVKGSIDLIETKDPMFLECKSCKAMHFSDGRYYVPGSTITVIEGIRCIVCSKTIEKNDTYSFYNMSRREVEYYCDDCFFKELNVGKSEYIKSDGKKRFCNKCNKEIFENNFYEFKNRSFYCLECSFINRGMGRFCKKCDIFVEMNKTHDCDEITETERSIQAEKCIDCGKNLKREETGICYDCFYGKQSKLLGEIKEELEPIPKVTLIEGRSVKCGKCEKELANDEILVDKDDCTLICVECSYELDLERKPGIEDEEIKGSPEEFQKDSSVKDELSYLPICKKCETFKHEGEHYYRCDYCNEGDGSIYCNRCRVIVDYSGEKEIIIELKPDLGIALCEKCSSEVDKNKGKIELPDPDKCLICGIWICGDTYLLEGKELCLDCFQRSTIFCHALIGGSNNYSCIICKNIVASRDHICEKASIKSGKKDSKLELMIKDLEKFRKTEEKLDKIELDRLVLSAFIQFMTEEK